MAVVVSSLVTQNCERKRDPRLALTFDGGFAFVTNRDGSMRVVAPKETTTTSEDADQSEAASHQAQPNHEAFLTITTGIVTVPAAGLPPVTEGGWSLSGYTLQVRGGQRSGADVELPPYIDADQDDSSCDQIPNQGQGANNAKWLLNLSELHPKTQPTIDETTADTVVELSGGSLGVSVAQGCWQLARNHGAHNQEIHDGQSLVYGNDSLTYLLLGGAGTVTFDLIPMEGKDLDRITIDVNPPKNAHVEAKIGYPASSSPGSPKGTQMTDFLRFYKLFPGLQASDAFVPIALIDHEHAQAKPGRECASVRMVIN